MDSINSTPVGRKRKLEPDRGESAELAERPISITCDACRQRKIKCSGENPCAACARSGSDCMYRQRQKPGQKPGSGPLGNKLIGELQTRVAALEEWKAQVEQHLLSNLVPQATPASTTSLSRTVEAPSADFSNQDLHPSASFSVADFMPNADQGMENMDMPYDNVANPGVQTAAGTSSWPPDETIRNLIHLYWHHVAPWAPIVPPSDVQTWNPPWSALEYAMAAVALRFSSDPAVISQKDAIHTFVKQQVLLKTVETTSIASLQAMALVVLDVIGSGASPAEWGLLALLTRSAIQMGLSKEEDSPLEHHRLSLASYMTGQPENPEEAETRRRLFSIIYMLDRYTCTATGWDFAIPEHEIKLRLPCRDEVWRSGNVPKTPYFTNPMHSVIVSHQDSREQLGPLAFLLEMLDLLGRVHILHSQTFDLTDNRTLDAMKDRTRTLVAAVKRYFLSLPEDCRLLPSNGNKAHPLVLTIHLTYYAALLKLNAFFAFPTTTQIAQEPFASECDGAIKGASFLAAQVLARQQVAELSPFVVWCLWVAARVSLVQAVFNAVWPLASDEPLLDCLRDLGRYWHSANKYVSVLVKAQSRWQNRSPIESMDSTVLSKAIGSLLDMRKPAYSAVNQPSIAPTPAEPADFTSFADWNAQALPGGEMHHWADMPSLFDFLRDYE